MKKSLLLRYYVRFGCLPRASDYRTIKGVVMDSVTNETLIELR
ncbi:MAG: hypothetical protein ACLU4J_10200 [Butyricimonas paravirosa]